MHCFVNMWQHILFTCVMSLCYGWERVFASNGILYSCASHAPVGILPWFGCLRVLSATTQPALHRPLSQHTTVAHLLLLSSSRCTSCLMHPALLMSICPCHHQPRHQQLLHPSSVLAITSLLQQHMPACELWCCKQVVNLIVNVVLLLLCSVF